MKRPATRADLFVWRSQTAATFNPGDPDWKTSGLPRLVGVATLRRVFVHEMNMKKPGMNPGLFHF